jgi:hypothetical protein
LFLSPSAATLQFYPEMTNKPGVTDGDPESSSETYDIDITMFSHTIDKRDKAIG